MKCYYTGCIYQVVGGILMIGGRARHQWGGGGVWGNPPVHSPCPKVSVSLGTASDVEGVVRKSELARFVSLTLSSLSVG